MPPGKQRMRFRFGQDGELTMVTALEPIDNAELADKLVKYLDATDLLPKPPADEAAWIEVTFSF